MAAVHRQGQLGRWRSYRSAVSQQRRVEFEDSLQADTRKRFGPHARYVSGQRKTGKLSNVGFSYVIYADTKPDEYKQLVVQSMMKEKPMLEDIAKQRDVAERRAEANDEPPGEELEIWTLEQSVKMMKSQIMFWEQHIADLKAKRQKQTA